MGVTSFNDAWFAVRAQPRKELLAEMQLRRQSFETFFPKAMAAPRSHASAKRKPIKGPSQAPFFPGYLFVRMDLDKTRWRSINGTIGVIGLVQFGDRPSPAPKGFIEGLIAATRNDGVLGAPEPIPVGAAVRLIGGPFDAHVGTLIAAAPDDRVKVLLELLGRAIPVSAPRHAIIAV